MFEKLTTEELRRELERREAAAKQEELEEILCDRASTGVPSEVAEWIERRLADDGLFYDFADDDDELVGPMFLGMWQSAALALEATEDEEALRTNRRVAERVIAAIHALWLHAELEEPTLPGVGSRVRLRHDVDRYPHFIAAGGSTGVVADVSGGVFSVRMDRKLVGAEEWDNEVVWSVRDGDDPMRDLEVLS